LVHAVERAAARPAKAKKGGSSAEVRLDAGGGFVDRDRRIIGVRDRPLMADARWLRD
jgi:hypothetical protein